jgi:hypothetical protein
MLARGWAVWTMPVAVTACFVPTPPMRGFPLETAAPVGDRRTGEQLEVTAARGSDIRTQVIAATLRVRRGFGRDTDVAVEATAMHVPPATSGDESLHTRALRAGVKHRLAEWLAVVGGGGAGLFRGGPIVAPDAGLIASWNNGFLEPFVTVRGSLSVPLAPRAVLENGGFRRPQTAWYAPTGLGLRVPVECVAARPGDLCGAVLFGGGIALLTTDLFSDGWTSFLFMSVGTEISF